MVAQRDDRRDDHDFAGLDVFPPTQETSAAPGATPGAGANDAEPFTGFIDDASRTAFWDARDEAFGDLGEFGVTSAELPAVRAVTPEEQRYWHEQRLLWEREQLVRAQAATRIERALRAGRLSGPGYDLLQVEMGHGLIPDVYQDSVSGWWMVWSAQDGARYTLANWEAKAQSLLPADDPERVTLRITTPLVRATPAYSTPYSTPSSRPWDAALDAAPHLAPRPRLRVTPPAAIGNSINHVKSVNSENEKRGLY